MEALILVIFFALYILVRILMGGGRTDWEKQAIRHQEGLRHYKIKEYGLADEYFKEALLQRPYDALSYVVIGEIALCNNEEERALYLGSKALRLDNTIWQAHLLMSKAFHQLGDYPLAIQNAKNAVWFGRDSSEAFHWYGKILLESGDADKGLEMLAEAYKLGEEQSGLILRKKGYFQKRNDI